MIGFGRERIFDPLGMTRSFLYEDAERIVPDRATGYAPDGAGGYRMVHNYRFATAGEGQLYTTVGDFYSEELDVTYHLATDRGALGVRIGRWPPPGAGAGGPGHGRRHQLPGLDRPPARRTDIHQGCTRHGDRVRPVGRPGARHQVRSATTLVSESWRVKLATGKVLVIDGGMGTELERRGVPMDEVVWSGAAVLSHPEVVRTVHEDYIRAGADVIITNTFGSTRQMLAGADLGAQVEQVHRRAVALAQEARAATADRPLAVAGSLSPSPPGFDRRAYPPPAEELAAYRESAQLLADSRVDLIALEMLEDTPHATLAMRAALETRLPVWLGVSCRRVDGRIVRFSERSAEVLLADILDELLPMGPAEVTIMHSEVDAVSEALTVVRERWAGPVGVYPESGYFTQPNWNFVDVISPDDLARESRGWIDDGARLVGGCCGTGPDHIRALRQAVDAWDAAR